jgi:hypothetical protein
MKRIGLAILFVAAALGVACGQLNQPAPPAPGRSSYDPMARAAGGRQPKGIVETTLAGVNPLDTDYGRVIEGWREEIFENTIGEIYFWAVMVLGTGFGCALIGCGWLRRERERRLAVSADIVTQLFNAYIGSRAKSLELIAKYNGLVERYNRLSNETNQIKEQLARQSEPTTAPELDYNQAKQDRGSAAASSSGSEIALPASNPGAGDSPSEVDNLRSQLAEYEVQLQRKKAQLEAKDNQISNLRSRLTKAHDSLEGQRGPRVQTN